MRKSEALRRAALVFCLVALGTSSAAAARRDREWNACNGSNTDASIIGCTNVLNRGDRETAENRAIAYNNRGWSYSEKNDYDRAIADYDEAIKLDPNLGLAFLNRGWAYSQKGDYDRAVANYDEAIRLDPKYSLAYNDRGWVHHLKGEYDKAIADYDEAIRTDPKDSTAYVNRCDAFNRKNMPDRALPDCEAALRLNRSNASAYASRGDIYSSRGQYDAAIRDYDRAIRLEPKFGWARVHRGLAYEKKGDRERARTDFTTALAIPPEDQIDREAYEIARSRLAALNEGVTNAESTAPSSPPRPAAPAPAPSASGSTPAPTPPSAVASAPTPATEPSPAIGASAPSRQPPTPSAMAAAPPAPPPAPSASAPAPAADAASRKLLDNRVALVIGNAAYPDNDRQLSQPIKDAQAMTEELTRADFDVITGEDVTKLKLKSLLASFIAKIKPGATALVFFSGYGIQSGKQSYLLPIDAQIWSENDIKRDGISIESILAEMNAAGAAVKLVMIDAARRNPFERRFRGVSTGLAPLTAPSGTLAIYSAAPDKVVNEADGANSLFLSELVKEMRTPGQSAEAVFNSTQKGVSRASKNEQLPWVSSSLVDDFFFKNLAASDTNSPTSRSSPR